MVQDSEYWTHEDGVRHLATQLMSKYCNLSVYGFQAFHTVPEGVWTDVDRLNACFFSQASRIVLFVPSGGEELILHFTRVCLTPLLTRPKTSEGRPDWHARFVAAAIGNVRVPNQLSQDVPFIKVVRFREVGWMRDVTAMSLLHQVVRDFWTPFDECRQNPSDRTVFSPPKADYSLMEIIKTTALVGTHTSVAGRLDRDYKGKEVSEVAKVVQPSEHRFRSRTRSKKSCSRSRSIQNNNSGYRNLEPEFEALQTDERLLDTRVILSLLPASSFVSLREHKLSGTSSRKLFLEADIEQSRAVEPHSSPEFHTPFSVPRISGAHQDSVFNPVTHPVNKQYRPLVNGKALLDDTYHTNEISAERAFGEVVDISFKNNKPPTFIPSSGTIAQFGQNGICGPLEAETVEDKLYERVAEAVDTKCSCVDGLKVTLAAPSLNSNSLIKKPWPTLITRAALPVDELKSEIVRSTPVVNASSFMIFEPSDISPQHTRSEMSLVDTGLMVENSLLVSIPFIDASSHSEESRRLESAYCEADHRIATTQPSPSPALGRTSEAAIKTRISEEMDRVDSVHKKCELNQLEKRYPRRIKIIRRSGAVTLRNIDGWPVRIAKDSDFDSTIRLSKPNAGEFTRPLVTVGSAYLVSSVLAPHQQQSRKIDEYPRAVNIGVKQAQAATQTETVRVDKGVTEPKIILHRKTVTRKEFISESTIIETKPEQNLSESISDVRVQQAAALESAIPKRFKLNELSSEAMINSYKPYPRNGVLEKMPHADVPGFTEQLKRFNHARCVKEPYQNEPELKQENISENILGQEDVDPCLTSTTETEYWQVSAGSLMAGINWRIVGAYALACLTVLFLVLVAYHSIGHDRRIPVSQCEFWRWLCNAASLFTPKSFEQD